MSRRTYHIYHEDIGLPEVLTALPTDVTSSSATLRGEVISDGGYTIIERGVCWNTTGNPTISGSHQAVGSGTGRFSTTSRRLSPNTRYYVRAYATNSIGTGYGDEQAFNTLASTPSVSLQQATTIMYDKAYFTANVTSDGGATVTERGLCWSTTGSADITDYHIVIGSGTGSFSGWITGLSPATLYYVRAYATNSVGTSYSSIRSFTTSSTTSPTVTLGTISSITSSSVDYTGEVTSDGGATVTERGVCWSTTEHPYITGDHQSSGSGTGSFSGTITSLNPSTLYYIRAYATNSVGTSYSEVQSFTTTASGVTLPDALLNFEINDMTTLTTLHETISNTNFTSRATSSTLQFVDDSTFGRGYKCISRNAKNVFQKAYSASTFATLHSNLTNANKGLSILMILDASSTPTTSSSGYRWGMFTLYNQVCFCGWNVGTSGRTAQRIGLRSIGGGNTTLFSSYYQPITGTNKYFWFIGIGPNGLYYYDENGVYQNLSTPIKTSFSPSGTLILNRSQEGTYYAAANLEVYGVTFYDDILTEEQIDYLVNQNHTTYIQ